MATNSKETQRKADAKRAGKRARAWTAIVYPDCENTPDNWVNILREQMVETLISPLHDKDVTAVGDPKKPHFHLVLAFKNPTTYEKAREVFDVVGAVVPPESQARVKDFRQIARYLIHADNPDKAQYNMSDVVSIGTIDYQTLIMSASDEDAMLDEIFEAMDNHCLCTYPSVVRFARELHPEWRTLIYRKYTRQISEYAKGLSYEIRNQQ